MVCDGGGRRAIDGLPALGSLRDEDAVFAAGGWPWVVRRGSACGGVLVAEGVPPRRCWFLRNGSACCARVGAQCCVLGWASWCWVVLCVWCVGCAGLPRFKRRFACTFASLRVLPRAPRVVPGCGTC